MTEFNFLNIRNMKLGIRASGFILEQTTFFDGIFVYSFTFRSPVRAASSEHSVQLSSILVFAA